MRKSEIFRPLHYQGWHITGSTEDFCTTSNAEMPLRKTVKLVQSSVKTCSWYFRCIPNFIQIINALTDLTKKKAKWKRGKEQENVFQALKLSLNN